MFGLMANLPDMAKVTEMAQKGLADFETLKNDVAEIKRCQRLIMSALNIPDEVQDDE